MSEWYSAAQLSEMGLKGLPSTKRRITAKAARECWKKQRRAGKGGGWEYHYTSLPQEAQAQLAPQIIESLKASKPAADIDLDGYDEPEFTYNRENLWRWVETRTQKLRDQGMERAALLRAAIELSRAGMPMLKALKAVAKSHNVNFFTLKNWYYGTDSKIGARHYRMDDWPAALVPGWTGRTKMAEVSEEAWDVFKAFYLTRRERQLSDCYDDTKKIADKEGWAWPAMITIDRKLKREISPMVITLARKGPEALNKLMPPMRRDRSGFHAMQAVNGDGITWKRWCIWPDGEVAKPCTWITQDLYSNKLLAWRTDKSENKHMFRLAYGDLVERWGIPNLYFIDNTMAAASKWMTGRIKNRYRWEIKDEDPIGIMPQMGTNVRFVTPGHGQSKPVERANKEFRQRVDKHPKFEGKGTKARPIPIDDFIKVMEEEFERYNAKPGRQTQVAAGRSFNEVFAESYEKSVIEKATAEQRRLWLCAAEKVRCSRTNGSIVLGRGPQGENRYWCKGLVAYCGQLIVVRCDPQHLHQNVYCYTLDGRYIGEAECTWTAGFADSEAAHEYHRARGQFKRASKKALEAERRMTASTAAKLMPENERAPEPDSKVVRVRPQKRIAGNDTVEIEEFDADTRDAEFQSAMQTLRESFKDRL